MKIESTVRPVTSPIESVTLTLSRDEAIKLAVILGNISGEGQLRCATASFFNGISLEFEKKEAVNGVTSLPEYKNIRKGVFQGMVVNCS